MAVEDDLPPELSDIGPVRWKQWRQLNVDQIEAELTRGGTGLGLRSGSPEVQAMLWRFVAWSRRQTTEVERVQKEEVKQEKIDKLWAKDQYRVFISHLA